MEAAYGRGAFHCSSLEPYGGLNIPERVGFRAPSADGETPGQKDRVARQQADVLLHRQASGEVDFLADIAAGLTRGVEAEQAPGGALPRAAAGRQEEAVVVGFERQLGVWLHSRRQAQVVQIAQPGEVGVAVVDVVGGKKIVELARVAVGGVVVAGGEVVLELEPRLQRSEEHTSELQSQSNLLC